MDEYVLREFVCKHCGHKVVVNPKLPLDYEPSVCTPCWENIVKPKLDRDGAELMGKLSRFLEALADPDEQRGDAALKALADEMNPTSAPR